MIPEHVTMGKMDTALILAMNILHGMKAPTVKVG